MRAIHDQRETAPLAGSTEGNYGSIVSMQEITAAVVELPQEAQLELARRIVASVAVEETKAVEIAEAVRGIEEVLTGKVLGLSEAEFRAALK